ncbi:MAG: thiopurine S-methyltransferase, partial [Cycloclasticus sp.]
HKRLLIAFDYDQQLMNGPPFAVSPEEVDTLFGQDKQITHLETASVLEQNKRFKERGITALLEHVFIVEKR